MVQQELATKDVAHSYAHACEVVRLAKWLLRSVAADERVVVAAAYCHDLVSRLDVSCDVVLEKTASKTRKLLSTVKMTSGEIDHVCECIRTASWNHFRSGGTPASMEAAILRDADWLDAIGAHGVARVFAFAGTFGLPLTFAGQECVLNAEISDREVDATPFQHFYSKLLIVKEHLCTELARREGQKRDQFMRNFLDEYQAEIERTNGDTSKDLME